MNFSSNVLTINEKIPPDEIKRKFEVMAMITPVVDASDTFRSFVFEWIFHFSKVFEHVKVITTYAVNFTPPPNVTVFVAQSHKDFCHWKQRVLLAWKVMRCLLTEEVDFVFVHMNPLFVLFAAPIAKCKGIPIVLWYAHKTVYKRLKWAHWIADAVVTASEESFRIESVKRHIIGHGINTDLFIPASVNRDKNCRTILSVARIAPMKQCELMMDTLIRLIQKMPELSFQLIMVGDVGHETDRPYFEDLKNRVTRLGLENKILFKGKMEYQDLVPLYQSCDVFLNTSATGSIDKAVLEAMACGRLVLTSNEAFKKILTPIHQLLYCSEANAEQLSDQLMGLMKLSQEDQVLLEKKVREVVIQDHSLKFFPQKIKKVLESVSG